MRRLLRAGGARFARACWALVAPACLASLAGLALPTAVQAQAETTLVSNFGQANSGYNGVGAVLFHNSTLYYKAAQKFTVGRLGDYTLTEVSIRVLEYGDSGISAAIHADGGNPGRHLYQLTLQSTPGTGLQTYTAPANAVLERGKSYFVVLQGAMVGELSQVIDTNSRTETGVSGWSIFNNRHSHIFDWSNHGGPIKIEIKGRPIIVGTPVTATLEEFDKAEIAGGHFNYRFDLKLSEPVAIPFQDMRDHAFEVTNGQIVKAKRIHRERRSRRLFSDHWRMEVSPTHSDSAVTVSLPLRPCDEQGAVCAEDGGLLDNERTLILNEALEPMPPLTVSIDDASGAESDGNIVFDVNLSRASGLWVEVDFRTTRDGTATADEDFREGQHLLAFPPGTTTHEIGVALVADGIDEEAETVIVQITEARAVDPSAPPHTDPTTLPDYEHVLPISDGEATGTINNTNKQVSEPEPEPLTAQFLAVPAEHDGESPFTFELRFSEEIEISDVNVRDDVLAVTGGGVTGARRLARPGNLRWEITVAPDGPGDVGVRLAPTADCAAAGAVCTAGGKKLTTGLATLVRGPAALSVADAEATEGPGATLAFAVTLSRAASATVTVDYATADGTAEAGADYEATTGTLTFKPGDTGKTVSVPLIDDTVEDDAETFRLRLSNASGAELANAEGVGTIRNTESPALPDLTASFKNVPAAHDGQSAFRVRAAFSEDIGISYKTLRDESFTVTGGDVTQARRVDGRNDLWEITVEPDSGEAVTITLPGGRACGTAGAVCTRGDDPRPLTNSPSATVVGPQDDPVVTNTAATGAPTISGTARVDETLTASVSGISDADGLGNASFSYQWIRGNAGIEGATDSSYTLVRADEGERIKVRVSFTDDEGHEESLTSAATDTVAAAPNTAATGAPTISGTARVDETLTASASGISDADGLGNASFSYQWIRGNAGIQGATGSSYTLVRADEGERIKVRVSFTDDAGNAESLTSGATDSIAAAPEPLTASFSGVPGEHTGETFTFGLTFSEEFELSYRTLRDGAFDVTGGAVRNAKRQQSGSNRSWTIHVEPASHGPVTIRLPSGSVETADGRALSHSLSATVAGPVGISVADARVEEDAGAVLAFAVTLSRAASGTLSVDYASSDGSAQAGVDYTAASGTLTFQAGESSKTIEVAVLDDAHDEGEETLTLTLSNASSGRLSDGEATGTIKNRDPLPRALLARFGRTAAVHVVEHVEERLQAPREPGFRGRFAGRELRRGMERDMALSFLNQLGASAGAHPAGAGLHAPMGGSPAAGVASLGMQGLAGGGPMAAGGRMAAAAGPMGGAGGPMAGGLGRDGGPGGGHGLLSMGLGGGDLLTGSAFAMNRETRGGILSFWSRGAQSRFAGRDGALSLGGDVRTTMFGADYAKGPLVAGLSLSHSRGLGEYAGVAGGQVASAVTGLYPWLGYQVTDRVSVWGVTGYGVGRHAADARGRAGAGVGTVDGDGGGGDSR